MHLKVIINSFVIACVHMCIREVGGGVRGNMTFKTNI